MQEIFANEFVALVRRVYQAIAEGGQAELESLLQTLDVPLGAAKAIVQRLDMTVRISDAEIGAAWEQLAAVSQERIRSGQRDRHELHKRFFVALKLQGGWPKNMLYWYLMKHLLGAATFDFEIPPVARHERHKNKIYFRRRLSDQHGFLPFALAACGLGDGLAGLPAHIIRKADYLMQELGSERGLELLQCIVNANIIFPPKRIVRYLVETLRQGLDGQTILLTGLLCPDYAYEATGDHAAFRYTFNDVGSGVGLVARQSARILRALISLFDRWSVPYRVKLAIADFEANSQDTLQRVGLDYATFVQRCRVSLSAFQQEFPNTPMELLLFEQEWANGRWQPLTKEIRERMLDGDFGKVQTFTDRDPLREIAFIAERDIQFYKRWHDLAQLTADGPTRVAIEQVVDRAAFGQVISHDHLDEPFIMISGSMPKKEIFNFFAPAKAFPVLCAKRLYDNS